MQNTSILVISIALLALICLRHIIVWITTLRLFSGYWELRNEIRSVAQNLEGGIHREKKDVVIRGQLRNLRTTVRFSNDENLPAVHLRMEARCIFRMTIVPTSFEGQPDGAKLQTGVKKLDAHYIARSVDPLYAHMFLGAPVATEELEKLCCSPDVLLNFERGAVEVSEMVTPQHAPGPHLIAHLQSMAALATQLEELPNADRVTLDKVAPPPPTRTVLTTVVAGIALCAGISVLAQYQRAKAMDAATISLDGAPQGIPAEEAAHIPELKGWRLANSADYDASLVKWVRTADSQPSGRMEADLLGSGYPVDHAYLLVNGEGARRLAVIVKDEVKFDQTFPSVALVARVPSSAIHDVALETGSPATGRTDGILLVRSQKDHGSSLLLSFNGDALVTGVPADYTSVTLK